MQRLFTKWFSDGKGEADIADEMARKTKDKPKKDRDARRGDRIRAVRERLDESQAVFGERFGVTQVTVSRWEQGLPVAQKLWEPLAKLAGTPVAKLFLNSDGNNFTGGNLDETTTLQFDTVGDDSASTRLPVDGKVGAGLWVEVHEFESPMGSIEAQRHKRFPKARQMAFLVEGDSMDELGILDGFHLRCVDFVQSGLTLQTGMIVVVEQTRDGGHLIRRTVKEVHVFRDRYELRPRSKNPIHQVITLPIDYFDEPKDEVRVIAVATGVVKDLNPFGRN